MGGGLNIRPTYFGAGGGVGEERKLNVVLNPQVHYFLYFIVKMFNETV